MEKKTHLTPEGVEKVKSELPLIRNVILPALEQEIESYKENGRVDTAAYQIAMEKYDFYTKRIDVLCDMINNHRIIGATECALTQEEKDWEELWADIALKEDGTVNLEQVKKELSDFRTLMRNAGKVYEHVTGGHLSKVFTDPAAICQEADDYYRRCYEEGAEEEREVFSYEEFSLIWSALDQMPKSFVAHFNGKTGSIKVADLMEKVKRIGETLPEQFEGGDAALRK